jgi:hypothetical protein
MDFSPLSQKQKSYISENYGLDARTVDRLLEDLWSFTAVTAGAYALRRHGELKAKGERNEEIYARLLSELEGGRFQTEELSERQVRRMIYG